MFVTLVWIIGPENLEVLTTNAKRTWVIGHQLLTVKCKFFVTTTSGLLELTDKALSLLLLGTEPHPVFVIFLTDRHIVGPLHFLNEMQHTFQVYLHPRARSHFCGFDLVYMKISKAVGS